MTGRKGVMNMSKLVNGKNYFNDESFNEMVNRLENGETIGIYIDCIGHTRDAIETAHYVEELQKKFGEKLIIDTKSNWYTEYKLAN